MAPLNQFLVTAILSGLINLGVSPAPPKPFYLLPDVPQPRSTITPTAFARKSTTIARIFTTNSDSTLLSSSSSSHETSTLLRSTDGNTDNSEDTVTTSSGNGELIQPTSASSSTRKNQDTVCEPQPNGTLQCSYRCEDGFLDCFNGGICLLDHKNVPVCSCPSSWTGPHCERKVAAVDSPTDQQTSSDAKMYMSLFVAACIVILFLVIIIAVILIRGKQQRDRRRLKESCGEDDSRPIQLTIMDAPTGLVNPTYDPYETRRDDLNTRNTTTENIYNNDANSLSTYDVLPCHGYASLVS